MLYICGLFGREASRTKRTRISAWLHLFDYQERPVHNKAKEHGKTVKYAGFDAHRGVRKRSNSRAKSANFALGIAKLGVRRSETRRWGLKNSPFGKNVYRVFCQDTTLVCKNFSCGAIRHEAFGKQSRKRADWF